VITVDQVLHSVGEVGVRAVLGHGHVVSPVDRREAQGAAGGALADVLVVEARRMAGQARYACRVWVCIRRGA
jgi:hypothetical protein